MRRSTRVLSIVSSAQLVSVINASAMTVVAPTIALDLGADLPTAQWFVMGAFLAIAAFLVPAGRMGDLIGRKPLFVVGFVLFLAGNLMCALAASAAAMIGGRIVVGLGASLLQGNSLPLLMGVFEPGRRASVIALQVSIVGIGGVLGPLAGGLIVDSLGWRAMFWIFCVLSILMIGVSGMGLKRRASRPPDTWSAFDWAGAIRSAAMLVSLLTSLTFAPRRGWLDPLLLTGFAAALVLLLAFIGRELTARQPMLRMRLFRLSAIAIGTAGSLSLFMAASSMRFLVPFHLQYVQSLSARTVGLVLVPSAIALILVAPLAGHLADRFGLRLVANGGLLLVLLAMLWLATIDAQTSVLVTTLAVGLVGVAMSVFHAPNGASMINAVEEGEQGVTSGLIALPRCGMYRH